MKLVPSLAIALIAALAAGSAVAQQTQKRQEDPKVTGQLTTPTRPVRELVDRCRRTLDRACVEGVAHQREAQAAWLEEYENSFEGNQA